VRRAVVPLLLLWAVVATILAIRSTDRAPAPPPGGPSSDAAEVEHLRHRVAELERRGEVGEPETRTSSMDRSPEPARPAPKTPGEAADRLLAEYRRLRDTGEPTPKLHDLERRDVILKQLGVLAERDRSIHLAWPALLKEARDESEAEDIAWCMHPDPGKSVVTRFRAELRAILAEDPEPFRRAYAAEMLMDLARPQPEDFRAALDAVRHERDAETRTAILRAMGFADRRAFVDARDAAVYIDIVRREVRSGKTALAVALAAWSDDRSDFDDLRERLERTYDSSLLWAFGGRRALTAGREAEAREVLSFLVRNQQVPPATRHEAVEVLGSLKPWDAATEDAVQCYQEELKRR